MVSWLHAQGRPYPGIGQKEVLQYRQTCERNGETQTHDDYITQTIPLAASERNVWQRADLSRRIFSPVGVVASLILAIVAGNINPRHHGGVWKERAGV